MTWLAVLLKPFVWPVMQFFGLLAARWGAIVVYRVLPAGQLRKALFDRTLLDRHAWIHPVALLTEVAIICVIAYAVRP